MCPRDPWPHVTALTVAAPLALVSAFHFLAWMVMQ